VLSVGKGSLWIEPTEATKKNQKKKRKGERLIKKEPFLYTIRKKRVESQNKIIGEEKRGQGEGQPWGGVAWERGGW